MGPLHVLLLLAASASAVQAAETAKPTLFVAWITSQKQAAAAKTSGHRDEPQEPAPYERPEEAHVCLQETRLRNCRCLDTKTITGVDYCVRDYAEAPVVCCSHHEGAEFMAEAPGIGLCNYQSDYFDTPVAYDGTATTKIGIFTATCEMKEGSEKCDGPLCEGMSITITGDILRYPKVAFVGDSALDTFPLDASCTTIAPNPARTAGRSIPSLAQIQYEGDSRVYYVGKGNIFSGTFTLVSRTHATKFSTGQFQMAYPSWEPTSPPTPFDVVPEGAYLTRAHQYHLLLINPGGHQQHDYTAAN